MSKIIESRNKREGGYAGKHYTPRQANARVRLEHRRSSPHGWLATLREIARSIRPF